MPLAQPGSYAMAYLSWHQQPQLAAVMACSLWLAQRRSIRQRSLIAALARLAISVSQPMA
jgi:hypothetical protein